MTSKKPTKPLPDEDPAQSQRFIDTARELEADGDLSPTDLGEAFERLVGKALPPRRPRTGEKT